MKLPRFLALLAFASSAFLPAAQPASESPSITAPAARQPVLLSVHGAWAGGWQMRKVAPLLEARGYRVLRPSLSGLGEHVNTTSPNIGLSTHIDDIVNYILFEDLHDVVLLGHSYGGMVITGVADRVPDRIRRLIYLDAILPENGESVVRLLKPGALDLEQMNHDGFLIPAWVQPGHPLPKDVPQPFKTFTEPIALGNAAAKVPGAYILTVDPGKRPEDDDFYTSSERARARGWPVIVMDADHVPQWRQPEATAALLLGVLEKP